MDSHSREVAQGERFEFGRNWARFLRLVDARRVSQAELSLRTMLGVDSLTGQRFLDAGSGSGLFSLAASRLGASVHSFDFDPHSVACTRELKARFAPGDSQWRIEEASVLDKTYLGGLGQFDIVYSWGVLHHTGAMWQALDNLAALVRPGGRLFVALYNDQGAVSRYWLGIKRLYVGVPLLRTPIALVHMVYPFGPALLYRAVTGRLDERRGMSFWRDVLDWVGGLPFEVAAPEAVMSFVEARGFRLSRQVTTRRNGCNEFVFSLTGAT